MINKFVSSVSEALADTPDGATVMIGGFGTAGIPDELIAGLLAQGARDLTLVNNNAGNAEHGLAALLKAGRVRKIICSFPRQTDSYVFDGLYRSGQLELELVPQGNLAERIRAAGAGIGGFFTPTGYGTELAKHADGSLKETREIDGRMYVYETPIHADLALIKAERGDRWGNLTYRKAARNFGPIMAMAARKTVATVHEQVALGELDPESVVTPGIFVQAVVKIDRAHAGGQPHNVHPRSAAAQRKRHLGHGPGTGQGTGRLRPDQRGQTAGDFVAWGRVFSPRRQLCHDARWAPGHLCVRRVSGQRLG
jgi:3-oxoadipate CoA-transferase alpha subunit